MRDLAYILASALALAAFVAVPYALLKNSRGPELFAFWTALTLFWIAVSLIYLWRKR